MPVDEPRDAERVADPHPRGGVRVELGHLVALVGLAGVAIAQPVLGAFGNSPETFVFRGAEGLDLVLFGLVVVFVPPLVLWGLGLLAARVWPTGRLVVQGASIGALVALAALSALSGWPRPLAVASAGALAGAAWLLTVRSGPFRMWSEFLVVLPLMALGLFLFSSPTSALLTGTDFTAVTNSDEVAPVVLIVLDELPTASIIDTDGTIDAERFPNLARLAGEGTWYRNHTTQSGFTDSAVPTIFTGRIPEGIAPLFTENPDNIFRLLAGSHDLVVSEAVTRLCPTSVCGANPRAPVGSANEPDDSEAKPVLAPLFGDALDLWRGRLTGTQATVDFGEFEEQVVPDTTVPASDGRFDSAAAVSRPDPALFAVANQPGRLGDFLAALQPGDRPLAAVVHLVSPHFPWHYLPDGRTYAEPSTSANLLINGGGEPWVVALERQRHLLQASYSDRLVGKILDRLDRLGIYDDAAIAVTADHGVAFQIGLENRRLPVVEALPEIMWTPLIIKAPGQRSPRVDDANVQNIDVLPTLAALIGAKIPWPVDGLDATGDGPSSRGNDKPFFRFESAADPNESSAMVTDAAVGFSTVMGLSFPPLASEGDLLSGLHAFLARQDLMGEAYRPTTELRRASVAVDDLDRLANGKELVLALTGTVEDRGWGAEYVVAARNGRIVAVSPVIERVGGGPGFAMLLPTTGAMDLRGLRLGLVRGEQVVDTGLIAG